MKTWEDYIKFVKNNGDKELMEKVEYITKGIEIVSGDTSITCDMLKEVADLLFSEPYIPSKEEIEFEQELNKEMSRLKSCKKDDAEEIKKALKDIYKMFGRITE